MALENQTVQAAKAATTKIPIVFLHADDPVAVGFVRSLSHPGGNLTGSATFAFDLPDKKLDLFKQMVPHLRRVLVLRDPDDPLTPLMLTKLRKAGAALQLQLVEDVVTDQAGIGRVFGSLQPGDMDGVYVRAKPPGQIFLAPHPPHRESFLQMWRSISANPRRIRSYPVKEYPSVD